MSKHLHIAAIAAAFFACGAGSAAAAALAPHKAVYNLALVESSEASGVLGVEGLLVVELDDACDSWASSERMVLRMTLPENQLGLVDYHFSAVEAKDGSAYRYASATYAEGQEVESRKGRVRTDEAGLRVAHPEQPVSPDLTLSDDTLFPSGMMSGVIDAALAGRRSFEGLLFDGVSEAPLSIASAAISPAGDREPTPAGMADLQRWRISAAYFDPGAPEGQPEYEVSLILYENGVAARMTMVYEDFTLDARLSEIAIRPACAP